MNYLRSMDYLEGKTKLEGEFKKAFLTIEDYYIQVYTKSRDYGIFNHSPLKSI